jgi:hypothetical protein
MQSQRATFLHSCALALRSVYLPFVRPTTIMLDVSIYVGTYRTNLNNCQRKQHIYTPVNRANIWYYR